MNFPSDVLNYNDFQEFRCHKSSLENKMVLNLSLKTEVNTKNINNFKNILKANEIRLNCLIDYSPNGYLLEGNSPDLGAYKFEFFKSSKYEILQVVVKFDDDNKLEPIFKVLQEYINLSKGFEILFN